MAACLCHFGSVLPITVEENLMPCYPRFSVVFKGPYCDCWLAMCEGPSRVTTYRDGHFMGSVRVSIKCLWGQKGGRQAAE